MEQSIITYRLLTNEEFESLEKQFVYYLASLGIDADAWKSIKASNETLTARYLTDFSNVIFENVLNKAEFLIRTSANAAEVFHCQTKQIVRLEVTSERDDIDFKSLDLLHSSSYINTNLLNISMFEKEYSEAGKEKDIFYLMENGCTIVDGKLYKGLCLMLAEELRE